MLSELFLKLLQTEHVLVPDPQINKINYPGHWALPLNNPKESMYQQALCK